MAKIFCLIFYGFVFISILSFSNIDAVVITPVTNISMLGGQYFFKTEPGSFGGNIDLFFTPVINFTPDNALLPICTFTYRGTKDVQELVGGGTLTQETADLGISLKYVNKFSDTLKGKIKTGYKFEYLKETKDEEWTKGLFDYNKIIVGLELEKLLGSGNLLLGYDYYQMKYPNYSSLVSEYGTTIDTTTYSEISQNAGKNVLDYNTNDIFVEFIHNCSETTSIKFNYDLAYKYFVDQKIVTEQGKFGTDKRNDLVHYLGAGINRILNKKNNIIDITDSITVYTSNQNSYDANNTKFIPDFYGFIQNNFTPSLKICFGNIQNPNIINFYFDIAYRQYTGRLAQDPSGIYKSEKIHQTTTTLGLSLSFPVSSIKGLTAKISSNYRTTESNMKYEKNYRYNYYVTNYFVGLEWRN